MSNENSNIEQIEQRKNPTKFPFVSKVVSGFITCLIVGLIWFSIVYFFLYFVQRYWESGGHFYEWDFLWIGLGILAMGACVTVLSIGTARFGMKIYLFFRMYIAVGLFIPENWDLFNELRNRIKLWKLRYHKLLALYATYAKKEQAKEQIENE